jgi:prepilin-type N-terminal cleavage/methylation domain-containing protein
MFSLKKQKGFTIVELLIVIVVIGILATLVIVTFTGIQKKARDSQRQTDINAVNGQLAKFYTDFGFYPSLADINSSAFRTAYMKGLDPESLKDPKGTSTAMADATTANTYVYHATGGAGCTTTSTVSTTADPTDNTCDSYTLTATLEGGGTFEKKSN